MKKLLLTFITIILFLIPCVVKAAYLENYKTKYTQPNGKEVTIYVTGDEYFRYSHDKKGNVLVLNTDGYAVYATLKNDIVSPTSSIFGQNNIPNNSIKRKDIDLTKNSNLVKKAHEISQKKTTNFSTKRSQKNGLGEDILNYNNMVVFVRFSGETEFVDNNFINSLSYALGTTNNDETGVKSYIHQVTQGKVETEPVLLQVNNSTYYSYQSIYTRGYVQPYSSNNKIGYSDEDEGMERLHAILKSAIASLPTTATSNVDADGDEYIDNIVFIVSGYPDSWSDALWPHQWNLRAFGTSNNFSGAEPYTYNLQFAEEGDFSDSISVLSHEFLHSLGMPDLYRYYTDGYPVAYWDMMSYDNEGAYVNSHIRNKYGYTKIATDAWTASSVNLTDSGEYELDLLSTNSDKTSYKIATAYSNQFIQLEYRGENEDNIYDRYVHGKGLLISRINTSYSGNVGGESVPTDEYYIFRPNETSNSGGFGDIEDAAIVPCVSDSICSNSYGSKTLTETINNKAITLTNGTNTGILIKDVVQVDKDTIKFKVFLKNQDMYLPITTFSGIIGETMTIKPEFASAGTATYTSNNTSVATVTSTGVVRLVGPGTTTISVTGAGVTKTVSIICVNYGITSFSGTLLDGKNIKLDYASYGEPDKITIYRSTSELGDYTKVADVTGTTFTDNTFPFGSTYYYKISATKNNVEIFSNQIVTINTLNYLPGTPANLSVTTEDLSEIEVSFNSVSGAYGYNIYLSNNIIGPYTLIDSVTTTSYTYTEEITFGKMYYFKVGAYKKIDSDKFEGAITEAKGINTTDYLLPSPTNVMATVISNTSLKLTYSEVTGATSYNVYRSLDDETYTLIAQNVNANEYTDTNLKVGVTYYYKVSAVKSGVKTYVGYRSKAIKIKILGVPPSSFSVQTASYSSINIYFDKMDDVTGYEIYYSTSATGTFKKLATVSTNTYTHKKLTFKKYYYYKVRSYKVVGDGKSYSNFTEVLKAKATMPSPNVNFTAVSYNTVKLSWSKVSKANKYVVYVSSEENGTYTKLTTTKSTYYTHKNVVLGNEYYYKVIPYYSSYKGLEKIFSNVVILPSPVSTIVVNGNDNTINHSLVDHAVGYEVLRKTTSDFEFIGATENGTYTDAGQDNTKLITYSIQSYFEKDGKKVYSKPYYVSNVSVLKNNDYHISSSGAKSILVNVNTDLKVTGYYLYISTSLNGKYKKVSTGKGNIISYTKVNPGYTYYFKTIPYMTLNGKTTVGKYSDEGIKYTHSIANINNLKATNKTYNQVNISYDKVSGVIGYQIKYKTDVSGSYKTITTKSNTYTISSLTPGKTIYYMVRSYVKVGSKTRYSSYSEEKSIKVVPESPKFSLKVYGVNSALITIDNPLSDRVYNIMYSFDGENYTTSTGNSYSQSSLEPGSTLYAKVYSTRNGIDGVTSEVKSVVILPPVIKDFHVSSIDSKPNSLKASWTDEDGVDGYELYLEDNLVYDGTLTYKEFYPVTYGKDYNFKVRSYVTVNENKYYSEFVQVSRTALPEIVEDLMITSSSDLRSLTFKFTGVEGAIGYKVFSYDHDTDNYTLLASSSSTTIVYYNATPGSRLEYIVVPYVIYQDKEVYDTEGLIVSHDNLPNKVENLEANSYTYSSSKITWDAVDGATGYVLYYSTSASGKYTKITATSSTNYTHKKLTTGKTYYYKVKTYVTASGKKIYSDYTEVASTKIIPQTLSTFSLSRYNYSKTMNKISWTKISGITGYNVYRSSDDENYVYVGTTTSSSLVDKSAYAAGTYYKIKTYRTVSKKKIYSDYSDSVYMAAPEKPSFTYYMSDETDTNVFSVVTSIANTGTKTLTIYSSGAMLEDADYYSYDRVGYLIDTDILLNESRVKYISSIKINSKSSKLLQFVFKKSTWYDEESKLYFNFLYDGVKYRCYLSSYYGSKYWAL